MGISFIAFPPPIIDKHSYLEFQRSLISRGIEFTTASNPEHQIQVVREAPTPLQVSVRALVPAPLGQLLVVAPHPARLLDAFVQEVEAVVEAYDDTWPAAQRQLIKCDATLRDLYETESEHAFKELWETWLRQTRDSLAMLGGPVLGGGLRLVMPAIRLDEPQIEVKIESYLRDSSKFFIETQFSWSQPAQPGEDLQPGQRLRKLNRYVEEKVLAFIKERSS